MVSNPRASCELIEFINDIKKSGLYILGHVKVGDLDDHSVDPVASEYPTWLNLIDNLKIKAFVELTLSQSIREGYRHMVRVAGLGGMKPNTVCLGFYDNTLPEDSINKRIKRKKRGVRFYGAESNGEEDFHNKFPNLRTMSEQKHVSREEYVAMISDGLKLDKNVCLFRHFNKLDRDAIMKSKDTFFIDVWPINFFQPHTSDSFDTCCLFLLQLACVLNMVHSWKKKTVLRVFLCVDAQMDDTLKRERKMDNFLRQLRILGQIKIVRWEHVKCFMQSTAASSPESEIDAENDSVANLSFVEASEEYLNGVNELIKIQCQNTAATFLYLPSPPTNRNKYSIYLSHLERVTADLPPTVMVHGVHPVTSTTL